MVICFTGYGDYCFTGCDGPFPLDQLGILYGITLGGIYPPLYRLFYVKFQFGPAKPYESSSIPDRYHGV